MHIRHVTQSLLDERARLVALELKDRRAGYLSRQPQPPAGHLRALAFDIYRRLGLHVVPTQKRGGYWVELGEAPKLQAGDQAGARRFLARLEDVSERRGWSASDRVALAILRRRWRKYASGEDQRFQVAGNYRGRLTRAIEGRIKGLKQREG